VVGGSFVLWCFGQLLINLFVPEIIQFAKFPDKKRGVVSSYILPRKLCSFFQKITGFLL